MCITEKSISSWLNLQIIVTAYQMKIRDKEWSIEEIYRFCYIFNDVAKVILRNVVYNNSIDQFIIPNNHNQIS